ncbi:radical SAM protein [Clostridium formicaceticum]|uniref:Biotin synthase n=1 Tax=Clostridium formicaceticum TaxID=1497 RepID=A0AAC9WGZ6_9CLOT|nr:radical SAM protein [Clostridium formicaceticum]AOY77799.1 radical SAM protein [Clostridium formicaceticum]ARE88408.1 biotin synthase [Clostridium formicaceticum]
MLNNLELIRRAKKTALSGKILDRESITSLLKIHPNSEEAEKLGEAAREVASVVCKNKAYLWAAIGLDYRACPMNCNYCSLGEKWGIVKEESEFSEDETIRMVKKYVHEGVRWIVLRTTQFYNLDKLIHLAGKIKEVVPGEYELGANVGEFDEKVAAKMANSGLEFIYHTLRLREGIDTKFNPSDRLATLETVKNSSLKLVSLVEPIGVEHTNEEIADAFLIAMRYKAAVTGGMARVPVKGTPLGEFPALSKERLAQIVAVTRLAAGFSAPDICVHQASELAIQWGANVAVVETGAIPRDMCCSSKEAWRGFDPDTAKQWFRSSGYQVFAKGE